MFVVLDVNVVSGSCEAKLDSTFIYWCSLCAGLFE